MNKKKIKKIAAETGFHYDASADTFSGIRSGFLVLVSERTIPEEVTITFSVSKDGKHPEKEDMNTLFSTYSFITDLEADHSLVSLTIHDVEEEKIAEKTARLLEELPAWLREHGFVNCCEKCGAEEVTYAVPERDRTKLLCGKCRSLANPVENVEASIRRQREKLVNIKEDFVKGTCGALLGGVIGALAIILLEELGDVQLIGGLLTGVLAPVLYESFGKKISWKGALISLVIAVIFVYLGEHLVWTIELHKAFPDVGLFTCFTFVPNLVKEEMVESGVYTASYLINIIPAIAGSVISFISSIRKR